MSAAKERETSGEVVFQPLSKHTTTRISIYGNHLMC